MGLTDNCSVFIVCMRIHCRAYNSPSGYPEPYSTSHWDIMFETKRLVLHAYHESDMALLLKLLEEVPRLKDDRIQRLRPCPRLQPRVLVTVLRHAR